MANVLFTNVRILDATGTPPYAGEVLVQGNRIAAAVGLHCDALDKGGTHACTRRWAMGTTPEPSGTRMFVHSEVDIAPPPATRRVDTNHSSRAVAAEMRRASHFL